MIQPKPEIVNARLAAHGGYSTRQWGQRELLDFSANINPFGPSPRVREAVLATPFIRSLCDASPAYAAARR
jgi:histidinol-phosphate/aromatic aminotransferase/cobyric acid decarboxylase-like protein